MHLYLPASWQVAVLWRGHQSHLSGLSLSPSCQTRLCPAQSPTACQTTDIKGFCWPMHLCIRAAPQKRETKPPAQADWLPDKLHCHAFHLSKFLHLIMSHASGLGGFIPELLVCRLGTLVKPLFLLLREAPAFLEHLCIPVNSAILSSDIVAYHLGCRASRHGQEVIALSSFQIYRLSTAQPHLFCVVFIYRQATSKLVLWRLTKV